METSPAVQVQAGNGTAPVTASPVTMTGYDTFGDRVETSDPNGNVSTAAFNQRRPAGLGHQPVLHSAGVEHARQAAPRR